MSLVKKDFRKNLKYLKDKRKDVIDSITKICSINSQHAKLLTEALFEEFREAKIERKLSLLFLMDSILKNCKEHYQDYLEEGISEAFCDAYEAALNKQDIRKSLRLLFKTWEPHFSGKTIMSIVTNIKLKLGEDINTSLSEEELDSLIEYYRKNGIDPSHLLLQKQILQKQMQQETKKPAKREIVEEESLLYVPADIKAVLNPRAPTEKKVPKPAQPRPEGAPRPTSGAAPDADVIRKRPEGDVTPHKKSIDSDHSIKKTESGQVPKRPEAPPGLKRPEGAPIQRRPENETPNAYTIKKKKGVSEREKPPLGQAEQDLNRIRKTVKTDRQPMETSPGDTNGRGGYGALNRRLQEPTRGPAPTQGQRGYFGQQQQPDFEEITQVFSDDESGYTPQSQQTKLPRDQPQRPFPHQQHPPQSQSQFQYQSQPQHLHPQHSQSHFQQQQQQQPQSLQSQQQQPHLLKQHPQSQQMGQFPQQTGPMQSHQMHHPQSHQFPLQGQFHGQPSQRTGPGSESQGQQQHHDRYPFPFPQQGPSQMQQQQQYRHPGGQDQQQPPGRGTQLKEGNNLSQIKKFVEQSLKKEPDSSRPMMETEPSPLSGPARVDSFPDPRTMRKVSETPIYDQGNALVFKEVLQTLKRELPRSIKGKYEYRLNRMGMGSLSGMVGRRDFRIVESLYEELPYRCSSCGLRFSNRTLLNKHLDWHFQFNMELKEKTKTMNLRPQLITTDHWIRDEGNKNYKTTNIENGEDDFEFENYVPSSEQEKACKACGEAFKEVWDKDKEAWLLDTATKVKYEEEEGVYNPNNR